VEGERRSFAAVSEASRGGAEALGQATQTSLKASQDMARTGRDAARRAGEQATDFWRASLAPMADLQTEFGRWMEHIWRQSAPARMHSAAPFAGMLMAPLTGQPLSDVHETDGALELRVELPGLKADDIQLALRGDTLVVSGEKADEFERGEGGYRVSERRFGRFERSFLLPPDADRAKIEASFQDGVLKVTIAKSEGGAEPKRIPIKG
jgi:HSP20 family molecular chaperone IbpA